MMRDLRGTPIDLWNEARPAGPKARCRNFRKLGKMGGREMVRRERGFAMRLIALIIALLLPTAAPAQVLVPTTPPPVNQEGMRDFCIYGNEIYSLGAQLCVPNSNAGMRCVPGEGAKSGGRAFWSFDTTVWPLSSGLRCGSGG
jgi:hypothetical protein